MEDDFHVLLYLSSKLDKVSAGIWPILRPPQARLFPHEMLTQVNKASPTAPPIVRTTTTHACHSHPVNNSHNTAAKMVPLPHITPTNYTAALTTAASELKYAQSAHVVDLICKDEDIRRLRIDIHVLEDDNDELRDLLQKEEDRSDAFEKLVNANLARAEEAEAQLQELDLDFRSREQELNALRAEKAALQFSTEDATAALTEKLALTRELSVLKPQVEHLQAQAASAEVLMTEKLALQRQLTNVQCEVENAKREAQRALAKRRNTGVEIAQEEQVEDLKRQLGKANRALQRAEEAAEMESGDVNVDDVRKQLAKERKARLKAEEQLEHAQEATQVEDVRKDLLKEKKAKARLEEALENAQAELEREKKSAARAAKRADGNAQADDEAEELRTELAKEKKDRVRAEKAAQQAAAEFEAQKATLEDKLNQFRTKLKSTKDKLKDVEAELAAARESAPAKKTTAAASKPAAPKPNPKKRPAAQLDLEEASTLGTPGDGGPAAKKGRKAAQGVGDKSTFTLTPFLNKTASVIQDDDDEEEESPAAKKQAAKQPLGQQPAGASNVPLTKSKPAAQRKAKPQSALEMVTEEHEPEETVHKQGQENKAAGGKKEQTLKIKTKTADGPENHTGDPGKKKPKLRKSLADFETFRPDAEVVKSKKRKLGGLGKTLFDEEDEGGAAPAKGFGAGGKGLFGMKGFGGFGVKGLGGPGGGKSGIGSSFLGSSRPGATLLTATDGSGFCFSPLKRARRGLDDTLRG